MDVSETILIGFSIIKGSLDEKLPSYEVLKIFKNALNSVK